MCVCVCVCVCACVCVCPCALIDADISKIVKLSYIVLINVKYNKIYMIVMILKKSILRRVRSINFGKGGGRGRLPCIS